MRQTVLMALLAYQTVIDIACRLICYLVGHDWHYFSLKRADTGEPEFFRCCMRCEKSEKEQDCRKVRKVQTQGVAQ